MKVIYAFLSYSKEQVCLNSWDYAINHNDNEDENEERWHRHVNKPRHGLKYSEIKKCLSKMMLVCIKQHLNNIWSSIHEKVKQHWGWVEKKRFFLKSAYMNLICFTNIFWNWVEMFLFIKAICVLFWHKLTETQCGLFCKKSYNITWGEIHWLSFQSQI